MGGLWVRAMGIAGGRGRSAARVRPIATGEISVYLCRDPVDFRAGINGLWVLVEQTLKYDPFSRNLFGFVNKRRNQIKVLYWQRSGFCLWQKRLEEERFKWPVHLGAAGGESTSKPPVITLTDDEFVWLLDGLDLKHLKPHRALEYRTVL